jgi:hypothetical protein
MNFCHQRVKCNISVKCNEMYLCERRKTENEGKGIRKKIE